MNETLLDRDLGIGDTWHCPLPNGYAIMMIDLTDQGWVCNPRTQPSGVVGGRCDAVSGVKELQVARRYILGASNKKAFEHLGSDNSSVDSHFLLDTQLGTKTEFQTYNELHNAAQQVGIQTRLLPIFSVYSDFRFSWLDVFIGVVALIPPVIGGFLLFWWIVRLRRTRVLLPQNA